MISLLKTPNFAPLFLVQFLGAFNDNLYKNAIVVLVTFKLTDTAAETGFLITLAAGLFILPFFLFSSMAGQVADRYCKIWLLKKINLAEVLIMALGAIAFLSEDLFLLYLTLFLMGTQSSFFGPIKYSILPEMLNQQDLSRGNALFSGSTFIAILLGTIAGGLGVLKEDGLQVMSVAVVLVALSGYLLSLMLTGRQVANPAWKIDWNPITSTHRMLRDSSQYKTALVAVLAISWFWFIGATLLSQIPALVKYELQANDDVVVLFLTLFSVGIALGAMIISRFGQAAVHFRWHGWFSLLMALLLVLTVWSIANTAGQSSVVVSRETLQGVMAVLTTWPMNSALLWMGLLAMVGGIFIVPLYTVMQTYTPSEARARMVASNNILNALFMVVSALLLMLGFGLDMSLLQMLLILAGLNLPVAFLLFKHRHRAG